jgi:hypothetical protein
LFLVPNVLLTQAREHWKFGHQSHSRGKGDGAKSRPVGVRNMKVSFVRPPEVKARLRGKAALFGALRKEGDQIMRKHISCP